MAIFPDMHDKALEILTENILPFWMNKMTDDKLEGFYGRISGDGQLHCEAEQGAVMYSRILWTFSAAYRLLSLPENCRKVSQEFIFGCLQTARRAKDYILEHFYDKQFGGLYWSLDSTGAPLDTKKQFYAIGFAIYGLSEFYRATGDPQSIETAKLLFQSIEEHSFDPEKNGYIEACRQGWEEIEDMRLSDKDANERKTMNTHLHILEPYTNLFRVWQDDTLRRRLENLIDIFLDKIEDPVSHHLGLFFDDDWNRKGSEISFGHDIEASWLLLEAAEVLFAAANENGSKEVILYAEKRLSRVHSHSELIAKAALEGYQSDGSMIYEVHSDGTCDYDRHWWVQAETVVGLYYQYKYQHNNEYLELSCRTLDYIVSHLIDYKEGEWFWSIRADGTPNTTDDKAGFWKCPYHNSRMCLELL